MTDAEADVSNVKLCGTDNERMFCGYQVGDNMCGLGSTRKACWRTGLEFQVGGEEGKTFPVGCISGKVGECRGEDGRGWVTKVELACLAEGLQLAVVTVDSRGTKGWMTPSIPL